MQNRKYLQIFNMKEPGMQRQFSNKIISNGLETPAVHLK